MALKMTREALDGFLAESFPQVAKDFSVISVAPMEISVRMYITESHLRPGGTVSGPSIFALADVSVYLALLAMIGPKALAVTTNGSLDFLRKPVAGLDLISKAKLLKLGQVLAVGDVLIYSEGQKDPVARSNMTYAFPPDRGLNQ